MRLGVVSNLAEGIFDFMITGNAEKISPFLPLTNAESLNELFQRSEDCPIVLFKHSSTCPISGAAYKEMENFDGEVAIIVIQQSRDISKEVEQRTGLRHESPQVIIVRNGTAVWNASHWDIKADAVARAIDENR